MVFSTVLLHVLSLSKRYYTHAELAPNRLVLFGRSRLRAHTGEDLRID